MSGDQPSKGPGTARIHPLGQIEQNIFLNANIFFSVV